MKTKIRGGSNAKAKRELGWQPIYPSCGAVSSKGLVNILRGGRTAPLSEVEIEIRRL